MRKLPTANSGNDPDLHKLHEADDYFANTGEPVWKKIGYTDSAEDLPNYATVDEMRVSSAPSATDRYPETLYPGTLYPETLFQSGCYC